ncbi:Glutamate receptor-interacting protein 2 [Anthophora quadrimaculata]
MFSSLRLTTMRSHKNRARPGSVATSASSDSTRGDEISPQPYHTHSFLLLDDQDGPVSTPSSVSSKVAQVRVEREGGSLGVTLRGGVSRALVVTGVKSDGPAAKEGRVRPGDRLLAVDDTELRGLTLAEAQRALRRSSDAPVASLTIEYDVANMEEARAATSGPLLVQLERGLSGELGLTVRETQNGVYIESLRPASTADRCGALQPGDKLLAVDETSVQDAVTAAKLLRNNFDSRIARLQILPRPPSVSQRTVKRRAQPQAQQTSSQTLQTAESLTVILRPDHKGFGLALKPAEDRLNYVVNLLEAGGPAERSGVLLPGDKVLAINRRILRDLQPAEVTGILETSQMIELMTEYKVGGPVVPSSGVFTVRVARPIGGQPDVGLTVNEDLIITEVRKGSLAYRTGSLAPGDRLLAIDGQKLDPGDLRQAAQLLHRPGSSVIALTVRKPDLTSETREYCKESSIGSDTVQQYTAGILRPARESLPSVDSAVDSWGELGENSATGPEILRLWDTASVDSGQLELPMPPFPGPQECSNNSDRPQQIVHVSLHKDPVYEDFGFSVSDGLYERGVYINRLRPGGPCDGVLRPYDRILRVNEASTEDCDCCLAVPLIAAAGPRLDLTIARPVSPSNIIKTL